MPREYWLSMKWAVPRCQSMVTGMEVIREVSVVWVGGGWMEWYWLDQRKRRVALRFLDRIL